MSKEQLLALTADVDRLLVAGSTLAPGDDGLRKRAKVLRELAPKVPALAPVAEAVGRVMDSPPAKAAPALLDLLTRTQQLRFSLAPADVEGPLEPIEPSSPWSTAAPTRDVMQLAEALTHNGNGRLEVLQDAIRRGVVADLRLVGPLLHALGSGFEMLADLVATEALPTFGKAILPELRRDLNLKGDRADARRLLAISKLDPPLALELSRAALTEGKGAVRAQALRCLMDLAPGEAEPAALELYRQEAHRGAKAAALEALKTSTSDAALEALLDAVSAKFHELSIAALTALEKSAHPRATERVVQAVQECLAQLDELRASKKAAPAAKGKGRSRAAATVENREYEIAYQRDGLLGMLGRRGDRQAVPALIGMLKHPDANVRENVADALAELRDPAGLQAAVALLDDAKAWQAGARAAWQLPPKERFDRLAPLCATLSHAKKNQRERGEYVLELFEEEATDGASSYHPPGQPPSGGTARADWDPRWLKTLQPHLAGPARSGVAIALEVVQGKKAVPALLKVVAESVKAGECGVVEALGRLRSREAIPVLIPLLPGQKGYHYCIHDALRLINDKSALPLLEATLPKIKDAYNRNRTEEVIEYLRTRDNA